MADGSWLIVNSHRPSAMDTYCNITFYCLNFNSIKSDDWLTYFLNISPLLFLHLLSAKWSHKKLFFRKSLKMNGKNITFASINLNI